MFRFKQFFAEKQFKKGWVKGQHTGGGTMNITIFVNPSRGEWEELGHFARGIVSEKGDLYMATGSGQYVEGRILIHSDLIEYLKNVVPMGHFNSQSFDDHTPSEMKIIPVQRLGDRKKIYISESMRHEEIYAVGQQEYIEGVFIRAKRKNSSITFYADSISDV